MKLIGQLTHKAKAHGPDGNGILNHKFAVAGIGEAVIGNIRIRDFLKHLAGVGPCQIDDTEGIGQIQNGCDSETIPPCCRRGRWTW